MFASIFGSVIGLSVTAVLLIGILWALIAILFRMVVPVNAVHIVQSRGKTISYGKDSSNGNSYYKWPSWIPVIGVSVSMLPTSVFAVQLDGYAAYDKGRLPFMIDIMAFFRIAETNLAAQRVTTFQELRVQLEGILQGACRTILATNEIEQILEGRSQFGEQFTKEVDINLKEWGVQSVKQIELMDIRDAQNSKVIANIMAKKSSEIDKESRVQVAINRRAAEVAETEANQAIEVRKQEAALAIGEKTAEKDRMVGIAQQQSMQAIKEQERTTMEKTMEVNKVAAVRDAEIQKETTIINAEASRAAMVVGAEGDLKRQQLNAEGVIAEGNAKGQAEKALLMAPVDAQITLAKEIGGNDGYQKYLVSMRQVEAVQAVGLEQAKALQDAEIKIIATGTDGTSGVSKAIELFSAKGGTQVGAMLEAFANTDMGKALLGKLTGNGSNAA